MIDPKDLLTELGYQSVAVESDLAVFEMSKNNKRFYLIDSSYEFDYLNEEAIVYLLASELPVLVHVPLRAPYEEYLASFESFSDWPIQFFLQGPDDGDELTRKSLMKRLQLLKMED